MAAKQFISGMRGVFLVAAELARLGFIVSPTSRSAKGADLLVTDQACRHAYSVQVKTNGKPFNFWLVSLAAREMRSDSHVYVLVNLRKEQRPDYYVVPSDVVAEKIVVKRATTGKSVWYYVYEQDIASYREAWERIFEKST